MIPATVLTDEEICRELNALTSRWKAFRRDCEEGYSGSPGEWMIERMNELETEYCRRSR